MAGIGNPFSSKEQMETQDVFNREERRTLGGGQAGQLNQLGRETTQAARNFQGPDPRQVLQQNPYSAMGAQNAFAQNPFSTLGGIAGLNVLGFNPAANRGYAHGLLNPAAQAGVSGIQSLVGGGPNFGDVYNDPYVQQRGDYMVNRAGEDLRSQAAGSAALASGAGRYGGVGQQNQNLLQHRAFLDKSFDIRNQIAQQELQRRNQNLGLGAQLGGGIASNLPGTLLASDQAGIQAGLGAGGLFNQLYGGNIGQIGQQGSFAQLEQQRRNQLLSGQERQAVMPFDVATSAGNLGLNIGRAQGTDYQSGQQTRTEDVMQPTFLGSVFGGLTNVAAGAASNPALFASDRRLKTRIMRAGEENGIPTYYFAYRTDPGTVYKGVMAQDLLEGPHADAVTVGIDGMYMVDYRRIGIEMEVVDGV